MGNGPRSLGRLIKRRAELVSLVGLLLIFSSLPAHAYKYDASVVNGKLTLVPYTCIFVGGSDGEIYRGSFEQLKVDPTEGLMFEFRTKINQEHKVTFARNFSDPILVSYRHHPTRVDFKLKRRDLEGDEQIPLADRFLGIFATISRYLSTNETTSGLHKIDYLARDKLVLMAGSTHQDYMTLAATDKLHTATRLYLTKDFIWIETKRLGSTDLGPVYVTPLFFGYGDAMAKELEQVSSNFLISWGYGIFSPNYLPRPFSPPEGQELCPLVYKFRFKAMPHEPQGLHDSLQNEFAKRGGAAGYPVEGLGGRSAALAAAVLR